MSKAITSMGRYIHLSIEKERPSDLIGTTFRSNTSVAGKKQGADNSLRYQPLKVVHIMLFLTLVSISYAQNLIPSNTWNIGTGSVEGFSANGGVSENVREWGINPYGIPSILWKAVPDAGNDADGGWNTATFTIDHTKMYRFSVWIKNTNSFSGTTYLGLNTYPNTVLKLSGSSQSNPYFWYGDLPELDKWYLLVGYVHGSGDPSTINYGAIYDGETGQKVSSIIDFKFPTSATTARHRTYLFYDTNTSDRQYFFSPRVDLVNGEEPTISSLLGKKTTEIVQASSKKTLNEGWYTIARNNGDRASAKFSIRETRSSYHSATHFYASHHFGTDKSNQINVLANSSYRSGGAFRRIRIVEGSTYAGVLLQVYVDMGNTTGCYVEMTENIQESGWKTVNWEPASLTLPNGETGVVRREVDLDINEGMIISGEAWFGGPLEVAGTIRSKEVKVEASPWPDYVFEEDYDLQSIESVEKFIQSNKHLPEVPSAEQVQAEGLKLSEMNALLLKKIEELTLYTIQQEKEIQELKAAKSKENTIEELMFYQLELLKKVNEQQKEMKSMQAIISELKLNQE